MSQLSRRTFAVMMAAGSGSLGLSRLAMANTATPEGHDEHDHGHDHEHAEGTDVYLVVGDTESKEISLYSTTDHTLIGSIPNAVINSHAGLLPLPDGTTLLVDQLNERLLKIGVHDGHAEILAEAPVPGHVAHIAVESDHAHYCAVGTSADDAHQLHIVNLETWEVTSLALVDSAEVGLMMTHDYLFHRNSKLNQVEAYRTADLLEGNVEILGDVPIGPSGHGEAVNETTGELFVATDEGVDVLYADGDSLEYGKGLAWPEADPKARGYFGRLINGGTHFYTYTSDRSAPETEWHTWKNRSVLYNVSTDDAIVTDMPNGYMFRYALAHDVAMYYVIGETGDVAVTIDLNPDNETFGTVIAETPLTPMSGGAKPGDAFYEMKAYRSLAIVPDASKGYVSQGGDGAIEVIDPLKGDVIATIDHASALTGGGTLGVFGPGVGFTDSIGR